MARIKNDQIVHQDGVGPDSTLKAPMINVAVGGQNAFTPDPASFVSSAGYVKRNVIAVLVEAPEGFNDLPNSENWIACLRQLVEVHPIRIEGLTSKLTPEFVETPIGGAGEVQQDLADVKRERSAPVIVWSELMGKPISNFIDAWITIFGMDPQTKVPRIMNIADRKPTSILPNYTGMTVMFFEPDPTFTSIVDAWLCTNMMPMEGPDRTGSRDLTTAGEKLEISTPFTAITQVGDGVLQQAQKYLDDMNLTSVNPNRIKPVLDDIDPLVANADTAGFKARAAEAAEGLE